MGCCPTQSKWDAETAGVSGPAPTGHHVFIIFLPAGRFLMGPLPPRDFAARLFVAVILPPLLFLAMFGSSVF